MRAEKSVTSNNLQLVELPQTILIITILAACQVKNISYLLEYPPAVPEMK